MQVSKATADRNQRILLDLVKQPGNDTCADCKSPTPRWASWNLGIFICEKCAAIHRKLGTHISKVRSLTFDSWTKEQVESMKATGNVLSNAFFNPNELRNRPPIDLEQSERDSQLERYLRRKYEKKEFVGTPSSTASAFADKPSAPPRSTPARSATTPAAPSSVNAAPDSYSRPSSALSSSGVYQKGSPIPPRGSSAGGVGSGSAINRPGSASDIFFAAQSHPQRSATAPLPVPQEKSIPEVPKVPIFGSGSIGRPRPAIGRRSTERNASGSLSSGSGALASVNEGSVMGVGTSMGMPMGSSMGMNQMQMGGNMGAGIPRSFSASQPGQNQMGGLQNPGGGIGVGTIWDDMSSLQSTGQNGPDPRSFQSSPAPMTSHPSYSSLAQQPGTNQPNFYRQSSLPNPPTTSTTGPSMFSSQFMAPSQTQAGSIYANASAAGLSAFGNNGNGGMMSPPFQSGTMTGTNPFLTAGSGMGNSSFQSGGGSYASPGGLGSSFGVGSGSGFVGLQQQQNQQPPFMNSLSTTTATSSPYSASNSNPFSSSMTPSPGFNSNNGSGSFPNSGQAGVGQSNFGQSMGQSSFSPYGGPNPFTSSSAGMGTNNFAAGGGGGFQSTNQSGMMGSMNQTFQPQQQPQQQQQQAFSDLFQASGNQFGTQQQQAQQPNPFSQFGGGGTHGAFSRQFAEGRWPKLS